jgi:periplasmic protein TonB
MKLGPRTVSIAATVALHAVAFAGVLQIDAVRKPLLESVPIMVSFITPPKIEAPPPPPKIVPPKPKPRAVAPKPVPVPPPPAEPPPAPLVAVAPDAPSPVVAPPPPRVEPAPVAALPPPAPVLPPSFEAAYLRNPVPVYPQMSKRRGEEGTVLLRVFVNAQGGAEKVAVRTSSGYPLLDAAAHDTVHRWRFVPARQGDQPVAAWVLVPVVFKLEG